VILTLQINIFISGVLIIYFALCHIYSGENNIRIL